MKFDSQVVKESGLYQIGIDMSFMMGTGSLQVSDTSRSAERRGEGEKSSGSASPTCSAVHPKTSRIDKRVNQISEVEIGDGEKERSER